MYNAARNGAMNLVVLRPELTWASVYVGEYKSSLAVTRLPVRGMSNCNLDVPFDKRPNSYTTTRAYTNVSACRADSILIGPKSFSTCIGQTGYQIASQ